MAIAPAVLVLAIGREQGEPTASAAGISRAAAAEIAMPSEEDPADSADLRRAVAVRAAPPVSAGAVEAASVAAAAEAGAGKAAQIQ